MVPVYPDDPGHGGIIESARLGQGKLQQAQLSGGDPNTPADLLARRLNRVLS
jgi:hypothetical protein